MNNYIFFNKIKKENIFAKLLFFAFIFFFQFALADGTKEVSPGNGAGAPNANGTAIFIDPATPAGSYPGSSAASKIRITITDHNLENIYTGFMARDLNNNGSSFVNNAYVRVTYPGGTVSTRLINQTAGQAGYIPTYSQAWNGPNIGGQILQVIVRFSLILLKMVTIL